MLHLPSPDDVVAAAARLNGVAVRTPVLRVDALDQLAGGSVFVKFESQQLTGAFKFRGAYNTLSQLDLKQYPEGVIAFSTGNHGQAIATVARMLGIPATVVMPEDAPASKLARARAQCCHLITFDRNKQSREEIAADLARDKRAAIVPPGDEPRVIAGQGTIVFEAVTQLEGVVPDVVVVPCGGGGLAAGTALALEALKIAPQLWISEPNGFDDTRRSLASGTREQNVRRTGSICDALLAPTPAKLPFELNRTRIDGAFVSSDAAVLRAMRFVFEHFRVAVEPGGVIALATLLEQPGLLRGKTALVVVSGGNVDADLFAHAILGPNNEQSTCTGEK